MLKESTKYKMEHKSDFGKEKIEILFEDQYLMVISKPSGMLSEPYPGSRAKTVLAVVEQLMRKNGSYSSTHRPFIVHRLDRDTSGIMMLAMTERAQKKIMDSWHKMVTARLYHAVAENPKSQPLPDFGIIDDPLAYNSHNIGFVPHENDRPNEKALKAKIHSEKHDLNKSIYERNLELKKNGAVAFKTVPARTHFKAIARGKAHTLFELNLDTGKKNQIRAHLASKGYPLAGDENYRAKTDPFGRLALHARTLEFDHPFTGEHLKFEQPEPDFWMEYVIKKSSAEVSAVWKKNDGHIKKGRKAPVSTEKQLLKNKKSASPDSSAPISRKKLSAMDFIQRGKLHHR